MSLLIRAQVLVLQLIKSVISGSVVFNLTNGTTMPSVLDPHKADLLHRLRQGYTQRMLLLYLHHEKTIQIDQANLSRWLSRQSASRLPRIDPDDEFVHWRALCSMGKPPQTFQRTLTRWRGLIIKLRKQQSSLYLILEELKARGVNTSIRSIRREINR
jgi:hypothetical protein